MGKQKEKPKKARQVFSEEYRREAVRLVLIGDRSQEAVANMLGISESALSRWVRLARNGSKGQAMMTSVSDAERIKMLEAENRELKLEREILKKATMFFVKHQV
jgi:transposase